MELRPDLTGNSAHSHYYNHDEQLISIILVTGFQICSYYIPKFQIPTNADIYCIHYIGFEVPNM